MDSATVRGDGFEEFCKQGSVGEEEGKAGQQATSNKWQIWVIARAKKREITSQSCWTQLSWLWFVKSQTAIITRHPACNSNLHTEMWGTGRSWLISSNKIVAQMNHTVWLRHSNATWHRKNWTKSISDYTHWGKRWMTLYMVRFHTDVPFQMPSRWNWDTIRNYC